MMSHFAALLGIYGAIALSREFLVVSYYQAVFRQSAGLAAALSLGIELLDLFVLSMIILNVVKNGNFLPAVIYAVCSSVGTYLAVKLRKKL